MQEALKRVEQYIKEKSLNVEKTRPKEEKIENIPCKNESEVEHYYFRMGIHLFLGYALGATDLHGENIIAHGEYPVIIDMETYPGYLKQQSEKDGSSVEEKINKSTENSLALCQQEKQ